MKNINRVLVITLTNIGDVILTTPVIEALLSQFEGKRLDVIVSPAAKEIFEKHKGISKIFVYDKHSSFFEKFRLIKKIRNIRYDMVVDLKNSAMPVLIGAKSTVRPIRGIKGVLHKKKEHLEAIEAIGIKTEGANFNIAVNGMDIKNVEELLSNVKNNFVIISCGAKSHTKRWPEAHFAALIDKIKDELGYEVILVGREEGNFPDSDRVVVGRVKKHMQTKALDFTGLTNLRELAVLIKNSSLLITNDSAPLHIGSAVNAPTLAIFGPTNEAKYGPLAERNIVLRKKLECAPCEKPQCRYNYECMRGISVDEAFNAAKKLLMTKE